MTFLSPRTCLLVEKLFSANDPATATSWLMNDCGESLSFQKGKNEYELARIRFAHLKLAVATHSNLSNQLSLPETIGVTCLFGRVRKFAERT